MYVMQKQMELRTERDTSSVNVGDINILLTTTDGTTGE